MPTNHDKIYLECDGHWNADGNLWAAKIISQHLDKF